MHHLLNKYMISTLTTDGFTRVSIMCINSVVWKRNLINYSNSDGVGRVAQSV